MDELLNVTLPFAQEQLAKYGEFYPFGAAVSNEGELRMVGAHTGDERPQSNELLEMTLSGVRKDAAAIRAVAFVADVRVGGADAIRVEIEHREGHALEVLFPYSREPAAQEIAYGQPTAAAAPRRVWT